MAREDAICGMAGGIPERRIRPIWDAIDSRQFKAALKHSQSLLTKHPNSPYALALKALILERMGKLDEALSVCLSAKEHLYQNASVDDLTLSTLQIVFQRLDRLDLATSCYEHACGKFPNHLELMMGLFNCFVREYSFVKQQQTAIKMYKIAGEERFLLWAVCSIQLQVFCGDGDEKLLLLAEGLLKKHIASHGLHEPEAFLVYISVLEQQAKFGDALEILSGNLGSLLMIEVDKLRIKGKLLARAGDYVAAAKIYEKILELCPDDYEFFLHYLSCLLEDESSLFTDGIQPPNYPGCKFTHLSDEAFSSRLLDAYAFVQKLQAESTSDFIRSPFLANLEIERRRCLHGKGDDGNLMEALIQYFFRFGHLACFTSDVEMYLQALRADKKAELLEKLSEFSDSYTAEPIKVLGQSITLFKIQELIGNMFKFSVSELEGFAVKEVDMYCKSLPLSKELDPQESMHGEELLSMVCNVLVQLFWRTKQLGYLVEAIMILECGLTLQRHASQYKILLLHLYSHLGACSLSYEWYKSLDVKNILLETVSHHILPQMLVSPLWVDLKDLLMDYLKFMDDHFRESADLTFLAYRHRNYSKVIEFVQFKERLQCSNQYLMAKIETPILQLKQNADSIEEEESMLGSQQCGMHFLELSNEIGNKSLTFNEDFQSRPWWTPTSDRNYLLEPFQGVSYRATENLRELKKERETNVRKIIEKRSLLPRLVYLSIQVASASLKENLEVNGSEPGPKIFSELKSLLQRDAKFLGFSFNDAVEVVIGVSSGQKSSEFLDPDMIGWLNFAVFLNAWNLGTHKMGHPDGDGYNAGTWHIVDSLLLKCVLDRIRSMGFLTLSAGVDFPILVQLVSEPLAWHVLIIQSCLRSSVPSGKKKKKSGPADNFGSALSPGIRSSIQSLCGILEEVTKWLQHQINLPEEKKLETILSSLQQEEQNEGPGQALQILESFVGTASNIELGDRVTHALKLWSRVGVGRKLVGGQVKVLSEFLNICELKLKLVQALKQRILQVQG